MPARFTGNEAMAAGSKSPPGDVHGTDGWNACVQVASPGCAGAPWPPGVPAFERPSPHGAVARWIESIVGLPFVDEQLSVRAAERTTEPAGTAAATSKRISPRRTLYPPWLFVRPT